MDPITATIVAGVLWFFAGSVVTVLIYIAGLALFTSLGVTTDKPGLAAGGVLFSWVLAFAWQAFVVIQVIIHAVTLFDLLVS